MNLESVISFLSHSNWIFLAGLIALLGGAFAVCFSEKPGPTPPSANEGARARPR
jgi:hypothetical protein